MWHGDKMENENKPTLEDLDADIGVAIQLIISLRDDLESALRRIRNLERRVLGLEDALEIPGL